MPEMVNYVALGNRIRKIRRLQHLTQIQVSTSIGISLSFYGHIERGSRKASINTLVKISRALKTTPNDLLFDSMVWDVSTPTTFTATKRADYLYSSIREAIDELESMCTSR